MLLNFISNIFHVLVTFFNVIVYYISNSVYPYENMF